MESIWWPHLHNSPFLRPQQVDTSSLSDVKDMVFCSHTVIKMVCVERNLVVANGSVFIADNATNPK